MRYRFIAENKGNYPVEKMCNCMKVSKNAFYNWQRKKNSKQEGFSTVTLLKEKIREIFNASKQVYGSYRVHKKLERQGLIYSRSYISRLMREMGLKSVLRRKFVVTTDSSHSFPVAKNVLDRDFVSDQVGEKWVSDITYVRVGDNWNYLTTILDLADRKVVGWSLSEDMTTENTVCKAWSAARNNREITDGFIFHSDRGVQYASRKMGLILNANTKITQSMSRKGNCWDNAVGESFFKTIKGECLHRYTFDAYWQLYHCINEYIDWYNNERLHSSLGYMTPLEKEIQLRGFIKNVA